MPFNIIYPGSLQYAMYIRVNIKVKLTNSFGLFSILWYIEIRSRPKRYYCMIKKWLFATKVYSKSSLAEKKKFRTKVYKRCHWPPRYPDLTFCFFFCGVVWTGIPRTIDVVKASICTEIFMWLIKVAILLKYIHI